MIGVIRWAFRRNQREVVVLLWNGGSISFCDDEITAAIMIFQTGHSKEWFSEPALSLKNHSYCLKTGHSYEWFSKTSHSIPVRRVELPRQFKNQTFQNERFSEPALSPKILSFPRRTVHKNGRFFRILL
jgi:hypothetical protein